MRKFGILLMVCACLTLGVGCAGYWAPVIPPTALVYTGIKAPLSTQFNEKTQVATKKGESSTMSILGLVALGDASIQTAAREGNLTTIHYADYAYMSVLWGVYTQFTTVVYGE